MGSYCVHLLIHLGLDLPHKVGLLVRLLLLTTTRVLRLAQLLHQLILKHPLNVLLLQIAITLKVGSSIQKAKQTIVVALRSARACLLIL